MAPAKSPSAHQLSCPACESHSCGSHGRAGKLTAAVCPPQLEPRRASSRTRRDKEKQGCRSCGETFNSITKRKHHCKLCGAVSPAAEASMCLLPPLHLPSVHTDPRTWTLQEGRQVLEAWWRLASGSLPSGQGSRPPNSRRSPSPPHAVTSLWPVGPCSLLPDSLPSLGTVVTGVLCPTGHLWEVLRV